MANNLCHLPADGKEVGKSCGRQECNGVPAPPLCHLPADGKDSLPSAGRWQRDGVIFFQVKKTVGLSPPSLPTHPGKKKGFIIYATSCVPLLSFAIRSYNYSKMPSIREMLAQKCHRSVRCFLKNTIRHRYFHIKLIDHVI